MCLCVNEQLDLPKKGEILSVPRGPAKNEVKFYDLLSPLGHIQYS